MRRYPHLRISARGLGPSGTSTHLTRQLSGTHYEPLRHPSAPGLSLTGVRLIIPDHALGLPVLRALSLCTCCRHYPGAAAGRIPRSSHPAVSAFPGRGAGSACTSTFSRLGWRSTRVAACTLALSPIRDTLIEGFSHFVTSMTAPIASGWSESPGGACTHWKAPPCHGAHPLKGVNQPRRCSSRLERLVRSRATLRAGVAGKPIIPRYPGAIRARILK